MKKWIIPKEKHISLAEENYSMATKLSIVQFINTAFTYTIIEFFVKEPS